MFKEIGKGKVLLAETNYNKTLNVPEDIEKIKNFDEILEILNITTDNLGY